MICPDPMSIGVPREDMLNSNVVFSGRECRGEVNSHVALTVEAHPGLADDLETVKLV